MSELDVDALLERAAQRVDLLEEALSGLQAIRARVSSEGGQVTVETDGTGTLTGLWMDDSISALTANEVAGLITATAQESARLAAERRAAIFSALHRGFEQV